MCANTQYTATPMAICAIKTQSLQPIIFPNVNTAANITAPIGANAAELLKQPPKGRALRTDHVCITQTVTSAKTVPIVAPIAPCFGISRALTIRFMTAPLATETI